MSRTPLSAVLAAVLLSAAAVAQAQTPAAAPAAGAAAEKPAKWNVDAPPGPQRDVSIDTSTGTWMSLDVSPDGREIVFDLLGDLYLMPIGGGEARKLTSGVAWDMHPRFSPDGRRVAFTSDRGGGDNIWVIDRDGSNPRQVTKESFRLLSQPAWSPDGEFIVARKHFTSTRSLGAGEMWLYHVAGGDGLQMTTRRTDQKDTGEPVFSPDGRYLYFSDDATSGAIFDYNKDPNGEIYVIRRLDRQSGETEAFVTGPGGSVRPTPSRDGSRLAFVRRVREKTVLYVMDLKSGVETPVWDGLERDMQETWAIHGVYPSMAWTPDDKAIVLWAQGRVWRVDVAARRATEIPFHVRDTRRVHETLRFENPVAPDRFDVKMLRWVQVSPRGDQVVYEALGSLWIRDLPNGTPRRLTGDRDRHELYPSWSRDGRFVVYSTWSDKELGSIRVVPARGGQARVVTREPGHYLEPTFSPDGRTIAFRTARDGYLRPAAWAREPGIYVVPAAGGTPTLLAKRGVQPRFGATSDRVFFMTTEAEGKRALRSVGLDRTDERTHLISAWASDYSLSPDEKWVAWTERFNAYVAPFARTGRTVELSPETKAIPVTRVTRDAGDWVHWSGDGRRLWWALGPELYARELKDAFAFMEGAPEALPAPPETGIAIGFDHPYDKPTGRTVLTGAKIVTMRGDEVIEDGVIVLNGARIEAVGPRDRVAVPSGARVIDVTGKTVIPGLIDVHWHGAMASNGIVPQQSWINYASLAFGVTTIHDPSNDTASIFAASELAKSGRIVAPRIFSTGTILYGARTPFTATVESLDDARSHLRRMRAVGAFSVKSYNQPRRDQRQMFIEAAREMNMLVMPEGGSLFQHNMTMVVDGHTGIEHSIPVPNAYDDVRQLWSQTQTAYTPTLVVAYGGNWGENYWYQKSDVWADPRLSSFVPRRVLDARSRRRTMVPDTEFNHLDVARVTRELNDAGVKVQLGAHGQREGLAAHWELWMFGQGGMTPMQALRAATLSGAEYLGMEKELGSIEPGKLADLVVLDADPTADLMNSRTVRYTILNGRVFDAATMNELGGRARARFWFEGSGGEESWGEGAEAHAHGHGHDQD